jgi:Sulfotransferase family
MTIGLTGQNLIFLISQPRAGSTLSQRILGSHPDVQTVSEPWIMLHSLYELKPKGHEADYHVRFAREAVQVFLQSTPDGEETYFEAIRHKSVYLYEAALHGTGKTIFLDKTPRYYQIIPELYRTFPDAHFIILLRNPLAVMCSILSTWVNENWFKLHMYKDDLLKAPQLLLEGIEQLGDRCLILRYEELLTNPDTEIRRICEKLNLHFSDEMIDYGLKTFPRRYIKDSNKFFGDSKSIDRYQKPNVQNLDRWIEQLSDPQVWRIINDYLVFLGPKTIQAMGYSYEELSQTLEQYHPSVSELRLTFSLFWLLENSEQNRQWQRALFKLIRSFKTRGVRKTITHISQNNNTKTTSKSVS